jgi:hypothetical protein
VVGPFAGVFLDRWRRQRVLLVVNLVRAAAIVVFATLLAVLGPTSPPVVALALVVVSANRFVLSGAVRGAAARGRAAHARDRQLLQHHGRRRPRPRRAAGVAVALRLVFGEDDLGASRTALVAAALYVVAALQAKAHGRRPARPDRPAAARAGALGAGRRGAGRRRGREPRARARPRRPRARRDHGAPLLLRPVVRRDAAALHEQGAIGLGFSGLGRSVVVSVVGGLLAALVTPGVTRRRSARSAGSSSSSPPPRSSRSSSACPYTHAAFLVAAFFLGFAAQASKICLDTLLQESIEDDFRGRVFSFYDTLFNVSFVSAAASPPSSCRRTASRYLVIGSSPAATPSPRSCTAWSAPVGPRWSRRSRWSRRRRGTSRSRVRATSWSWPAWR